MTTMHDTVLDALRACHAYIFERDRDNPIFQKIDAAYDLWVGVFVDRKGQRIYILPVPCIGVIISWLKL